MKTTKEIYADVMQKDMVKTVIAKQYDCNSRFLCVRFASYGVIMQAAQDDVAVVNVQRSDGEVKAFRGTVNEDGSVTVPLTSWMSELAGTLKCDISIVSPDGSKLTSMVFPISVEPAVYSGEEISEDEHYDILVSLITDVQNTEAAITAAETARVEAEKKRTTAETARDNAEKDRNTAESNRKLAEDNRNTAETSRAEAESNRQSAETERAAAETARAEAEEKRNAELEKKADKATTIEGYGITDAYTKTEVDDALNDKANKQNPNNGSEGGKNANASDGGGAIGLGARVTGGGGAVGQLSYADCGGSIGLNASSYTGGAIGNDAVTISGGAVGDGAYSNTGGAIGIFASSESGGAVGNGAVTGDGFAGGYLAKAQDENETGIDAIQLGTGTNRTPKTFQVYDYRMMDTDGNIPLDRLSNGIDTTPTENSTKLITSGGVYSGIRTYIDEAILGGAW